MSKVAGFIIGSIEIGIGIATSNPMLIIQGSMMIVSQAVVDLTAGKKPARDASEMTIALGEQPRVLLVGETFTPGSLVDGFDWGGKYGSDWEALVIRLADHKCHSLTGFFVNDQYFPYVGDGLVPAFDDQLEIYFRADTTNDALPAIVTDHGPGWKSTDLGESGCDVIVAYKADKTNDKHPAWPGGRPRFGFVVKGALCYDPRKDSTVPGGSGPHRDNDPSTWEWSENAVICRYKWVRGVYANDDVSDQTKLLVGRGLNAIEAPPENIIAAANVCDEIVAAVQPSDWVATDCFGNTLSPDGTTLYSVHGSSFSTFYLPTRSQIVSTTLAVGAIVGGPVAATLDGVYYDSGSSGIYLANPRDGSSVRVVAPADMHLVTAGLGYAGGQIWAYPFASWNPDVIGLLSGGALVAFAVNFNATHVFTNAAGAAIALGTTSGNVLAIGPAGDVATLISTAAYGTSGPAYGFDPDDGAHYIVRQGTYLFFVTKGGTPTIALAVDTGSAPDGLYDSIAATPIGAASFWQGAVEYASADLSIVRTIDPTLWNPVPGVGGFEIVGYFFDPINDALLSRTNSSPGIILRYLDRNGSYRVAGPIYANQEFIDVEGMFASATAGNIVTHEGSVELDPGIAKSVGATFTDKDLLSGSQVSWNQGFLSQANTEWVNTVVGRYIEPDQKWNDHATPPARVNTDIVADGKPREAQLPLRLVRYRAQAQRICEINRRLGRLWGRATIKLGPRFCEIEEGDWVQWQSDRYFAGATKTFRVDAYKLDEKWQVTLTLREIAGEVFADDATFPHDFSHPLTTPPPASIGTPAGGNWMLAAITLDSSGASVPALEITGSASDDPYADAIIFEYWKSDGVTNPTVAPDLIPWISAGASGTPDTTKVDITSVTGGATYYAAVSYVVDGITGDRLVLGPVTVADYNPNPVLTLEDNVTLLTLEDDATAINLG